MALANINDFKEIVKQKVFPNLVSKDFANADELNEHWIDWMNQKSEWFSERIVPINNNVSSFKTITTAIQEVSRIRRRIIFE